MELNAAVDALAALAHSSRLEVFRLLVKESDGLFAGDIAAKLDIPKPTLSFHLKELSRAGLVEARREGRSIAYSISVDGMRDLMEFLTEDCCKGRPELCLPNSLDTCCAPSQK